MQPVRVRGRVLLVTMVMWAVSMAQEGDTLQLTRENFDKALKDNDLLLVEFYDPACVTDCQLTQTKYVKAVEKLIDTYPDDTKLATVDANIEKDIAAKYGVKELPDVKVYRKGKVMDEKAITRLAKKKDAAKPTRLSDTTDLTKFIDDREVSVIAYFRNRGSTEAKNYQTMIEDAYDIKWLDVEFAITYNESLINLSGHRDMDKAIVLFKKFDEGRRDYFGDYEVEGLMNFVKLQSRPIVTIFRDEVADSIFKGGIRKQMFLFASKTSKDFRGYFFAFKDAAVVYREKVIFVFVNTDVAKKNKHTRDMLEFFDLSADKDMPAVRFVKLGKKLTKYEPETTDYTPDNLKKFVKSVLDGTIKVSLKSADVADGWDSEPVKVLVGKNFNQVVKQQKDKSYFVEFYAPWCGHCKELAPIWEKLGEKYKDSTDVVIAKMDSTANEVEDVEIGSYPTIKYFPRDGEVVDYEADRTFEALDAFLQKQIAIHKRFTKEEL